MNLKTKAGAFLCVDCGKPVTVKNDKVQEALEAGYPIKCTACMREKKTYGQPTRTTSNRIRGR